MGWMRLGKPGHSMLYDRHGNALVVRKLSAPTEPTAPAHSTTSPAHSKTAPACGEVSPPRTPCHDSEECAPRPTLQHRVTWRLDVPESDDPFRRRVTTMLRADFPHLCSAMDVEHIAAAAPA